MRTARRSLRAPLRALPRERVNPGGVLVGPLDGDHCDRVPRHGRLILRWAAQGVWRGGMKGLRALNLKLV